MARLTKVFLWICFVLMFWAPVVFADDVTITTYYPSPYGSYSQLQANRLAVGDTDGNGSLGASDQPSRDGDMRFKPQIGDPTAWPAGGIGQVSYSRVKDSLYHYNGSTWVPSGGGGCYVSYSAVCLPGFTRESSSIGTWYGCAVSGSTGLSYSFFIPPGGGGCPLGFFIAISGSAYVCCK
ncbi:MAG: hypothetical protein V1869_05875 [Candidatus Omnitrophota bacterium]